jgi:hypothetical protein
MLQYELENSVDKENYKYLNFIENLPKVDA